MKKLFTRTILALAFLVIGINHTQAQYVTIQDNNFKNWLMQQYPSCFNVSQEMDTTCSDIVNETSLTLPNWNTDTLSNISAIQYFDNLHRIYIDNNNINAIDRFPSQLKKINIFGNPINTLPAFPAMLDTLMINGISQSNNLSSLSFPNSIIHLELSGTNLAYMQPLPPNLISLIVTGNNFTYLGYTNLLNGLPSSLLLLNVDGCGINSIPQLPPNLLRLSCNSNQLYNLPNLPSSLLELHCENNNLSQLPTLPNNLTNLSAGYSSISSLPNTLPPNLLALNMQNSNLDTIPNIPQSLAVMIIDNNPLTELPSNISTSNLQLLSCASCSLTYLPAIPNLGYLNCSNNQITCLGELSQNINNPLQFYISNNPFTCVPNYVPAMDSAFVAAYPLCVLGDSVNNPFNCSIAKGITGRIYRDNNSNCDFDTPDNILKNIKVNFFNPINSSFSSTYSGLSGVYYNTLDPSMYIMNIDTLSNDYTYSCQYPGLDTMVNLTLAQPLAQDVNFSLKCNNGYDVGVKSITPKSGISFPGQLHTLQIVAGDLSQWYNLNCAQGVSGQVTITLNGPVTLSSIAANALAPSSVNGNVLTYNIADFSLVDIDSAFIMTLMTDTTAQSGDQICIQVSVTATGLDNNPLNNTYTQCYPAVNSYDPNYKEVYPTDVLPGYQDWLTYTIHFQNLGNAPAFNIRVLDTLSTNLNLSTFEIIGYSHQNNTLLVGNILTMRFPNIMLPDSASDPSGSQGFIKYRIKPLANLPVGTQIENTAHIYFDFNPAVVTNTSVNNFTTAVGNTSISESKKLFVYPNPSTGIFTISSAANIEVYNIVGELILFENNATSIDITAAPKGMYFVKLNGGKIEKLIKN